MKAHIEVEVSASGAGPMHKSGPSARVVIEIEGIDFSQAYGRSPLGVLDHLFDGARKAITAEAAAVTQVAKAGGS